MPKSKRSQNKGLRLPEPHQKPDEFGPGKKGLVICENCRAFYYQKSWHHDAGAFIAKREDKDMPVNFNLCPACKMIVNHQYEGRISIKNIPEKLKAELTGLIKGFCERAYSRDCQHRLIEIKEDGANLAVTVTENELANKLTDKIKDTFNNKVKTGISFNREPSDVAEAVVEFLSS